MKNYYLLYLLTYLLFCNYHCCANDIEIIKEYTCTECNGQPLTEFKSVLTQKAIKDIVTMVNTGATQDEISKMIYLKYGDKIFKSFAENTLSELVFSISKQLRCLECSKQILSESQSRFADNVKVEIRTMLICGMTRNSILTTLADKYGEEILQDFNHTKYKTLILLVISILVFMLISIIIIFYIHNVSCYIKNYSIKLKDK